MARIFITCFIAIPIRNPVKLLNPMLVNNGLKLFVAAAILSIATFASSSSFQITFNSSSNVFTAGKIATRIINFL